MNDEQLDKLFQDQFNNMERSPDDDVWKKIALDLDSDEKRIIPIWKKSWVRYAAAIVLIGGVSIWAVRNIDEQTVEKSAHIARQTQQPEAAEDVTEKVQTNELDNALPTKTAEQKEERIAMITPVERKTQKEGIKDDGIEKRQDHRMRIRVQLPEVKLVAFKSVTTENFNNDKLKTHQVVEIDPIQPLIENPEEEETMLAARPSHGTGLVSGLLNKISDVVNPDDSKTIHFSNDEEGSLRIDIFNSLVKNRTKKRK